MPARRRPEARLRRGAVVAIGLSVAAAVAGCGASNAATPGATASAGFAAYTACLRANGVNLPARTAFPSRSPRPAGAARPSGSPGDRPGLGPGGFGGAGGFGLGDQPPPGVDQSTWDRAMKACTAQRPNPGPSGRNNSAFVAYRNCLADHGVSASADPLRSGDPAVAAALRICAPLRPSGRPTATPSPPA